MATQNYPNAPGMVAELEVLLSQLAGGGSDHEVVDISSTDHTATMTNCRFMTCTAGTTIKIDYVKDDGTTGSGVILPAERRLLPYRRISKVYKTGTDATNIYLHR